jgi:hypothetical protein
VRLYLEMVLRLAIATLLGAMAGIHLVLWLNHGYRYIPNIGPLFMLNVVAGSVLCISTLIAPRKIVLLVALGGALVALSSIGALLISVNASLFGFSESTHAPYFAWALGTEASAAVLAAGLAGLRVRRLLPHHSG